jgi:hypothetical protein
MIVYFSEKSKKACRDGGIFVLLGVSALYCLFVWSKILKEDLVTIQIVRSEAFFEVKDAVKSEAFVEKGVEGEFAFVASKKGVYYYPINCSRAKILSVKNMLYFKDKMSAEQAGYKAYSGCI